jgi:hypothetical protein
MGDLVIILLLAIAVILWRYNSQLNKKLAQMLEVIEAENKTTEDYFNDTTKDYLKYIYRSICEINESISKLVSIATIEYPAGTNFYAYVRGDNLINIYAGHLEHNHNMPQDLALKRAQFEVAMYGQDAVAEKINTGDYRIGGVAKTRKEKALNDFFGSGIIEKDIETRLEKEIIPCHLYAPLYDLIVKQNYSGKKDFVAELITYTIKTYDEMINRAAIISKLEQLGVLLRVSGEKWGARMRFRLKSKDTYELKEIIYAGGSSHDDDFFEEQFKEGELSRIFDGHHYWG